MNTNLIDSYNRKKLLQVLVFNKLFKVELFSWQTKQANLRNYVGMVKVTMAPLLIAIMYH
jgi:hypothetical protein